LIDLSSNNFSGDISESLASLKQLQLFTLSNISSWPTDIFKSIGPFSELALKRDPTKAAIILEMKPL